jgi:hypothetical protein
VSFNDSERPTGTLCACCAGEGRILVEEGSQYKAKKCPWCTAGVQTPVQLEVWKNRRRLR